MNQRRDPIRRIGLGEGVRKVGAGKPPSGAAGAMRRALVAFVVSVLANAAVFVPRGAAAVPVASELAGRVQAVPTDGPG